MRVIHKFGPYSPLREFEITSRQIVQFALQGGQMFIWAEIDKEGRNETRTYVIVGTGMDYEIERKHFASLVDHNQMVWHLLEEPSLTDVLRVNIFGGS